MEVKIIKTLDEYHAAIEFMEALGDREDFEENQKIIDQFELITLLVELYEKENFPFKPGHPLEIIKLKMDMLGIQQKDLVPLIGSSGVVSEVFNKKRGLSKTMIKNFAELLHVDQAILNVSYPLDSKRSQPENKKTKVVSH